MADVTESAEALVPLGNGLSVTVAKKADIEEACKTAHPIPLVKDVQTGEDVPLATEAEWPMKIAAAYLNDLEWRYRQRKAMDAAKALVTRDSGVVVSPTASFAATPVAK